MTVICTISQKIRPRNKWYYDDMQIKRQMVGRRFVIILCFVVIVTIAATAVLMSGKISAPRELDIPYAEKPAQDNKAKTEFDRTLYSVSDPASPWVIVNKSHALQPKTYQPSDLVSVGGSVFNKKMAPSLRAMIAKAKSQGVSLRVISGYRSYDYQSSLYNAYVKKDGQAAADTYSARPGHSEHQTGLAVDLGGSHGCSLEVCFGKTPEGIWLSDNAATFGFIIRYLQSNQSVTGYQAEPWHLRFVGTPLAKEMQKQGVTTLEEFFGVAGGKEY